MVEKVNKTEEEAGTKTICHLKANFVMNVSFQRSISEIDSMAGKDYATRSMIEILEKLLKNGAVGYKVERILTNTDVTFLIT